MATTWGLGIEHEMLFGIDEEGAQHALLSNRVVDALFQSQVEHILKRASAALGVELPRPMPGATQSVVIGDPKNAPHAWRPRPELASRVDKVRDDDIAVVVFILAPHVASFVPFDFEWHLWHEIRDLPPRERLRLVVAGGDLLTRFEASIQVPKLTKGTVWFHPDVETATPSPATNNRRAGKHCSRAVVLRDVLVCLAMRASSRKLNLPIEQDGHFVEVKTLQFRRAKIRALEAELARSTRAALAAARSLDPTAHVLPHSGYGALKIVGTPREARAMYAGSYHFWFTLPHEPRLDSDMEFVRRHAAFARCLQWLEPLLLCLCGGDPRAIGQGTTYPRANMRGTLNQLAGLGTTRICRTTSDMDVTVAAGQHFDYVDASGKSRVGTGPARIQVRLPGVHRPVPVMSCQPVDRWSEEADGPRRHVATLPDAPISSRRWALDEALMSKYHAGFTVHPGSDMRFTWCDAFGMPLKPGWSSMIQQVNSAGGGQLEAWFKHKKTGEIARIAPLKPKAKRDLVGFEFRLMDNMRHEAVLPLLQLFVLTAAASTRGGDGAGGACKDVIDDRTLVDTVADVLVRGRCAPVSAAFMRKLAAALHLRAQPPTPRVKDAYEALCWVSRTLFEENHKHPWCAAMGLVTPHIMPLDTNLEAYRDALGSRQLPAELGPEWEYDVPYLKLLGISSS